MKMSVNESTWSHAGITLMAQKLSEEERLIVCWTTGLVFAGTGLLPPTRFLCLGCCTTVEAKGAEHVVEGRPVCPQCQEPAHPHTCLTPVQAGWTGWHAFSKIVNPDFRPPVYYRTLAETIEATFTEETVREAPNGTFGLLQGLMERRHLRDLVPLLGRLCLELHDAQAEEAVQQALCHLLGAFCLAPQIPKISRYFSKYYEDAKAQLGQLSEATERALAAYRTRFMRLSERFDGGMQHVLRQQKDVCHALSHGLDSAVTAAQSARLQQVSRRLAFQAALPAYKQGLRQIQGRMARCYSRDLSQYAEGVLAKCQRGPDHAVAELAQLINSTDRATRLVDQSLIAGWTEGGGGAASMVAARAAEHLALGWVRGWVPASDDVQDMSRLQIENPLDRRWIRGDISRIGASDDQEIFYDVKNTYVREGRYSSLGIRHKKPGKTEGISYIGTLTRVTDRSSWKSEDEALQSQVPLYVTGIYSKDVLKAVKTFAKEHTSCVAVDPVDLWGADSLRRERTLVPAFLFVMPQAAWNPFYATVAGRRFLACMKDYDQRSILKFFCKDDAFPGEMGVTAFSARMDSLLRKALCMGRTPPLFQVYFTVLDALVTQFNDQIRGLSGKSVEAFLQETQAVFLGGDFKKPLGAWDPSESLHLILKAFGQCLKAAQGRQKTGRLPRITRLEISKAGTLFARMPDGGKLTLVSHCDKTYPGGDRGAFPASGPRKYCLSWPLIFGNDEGQISGLPPARSCGKCGRLLCNQGHGCPGADPDDMECLWNTLKTPWKVS
ncbi:MAG: hypothetical protein ABF513_08705 [Acetobacter malorum]